MTTVRIDARKIHDAKTFHDVFAEAFGFPAFYGRNINAWIDCMSDLGNPSAEMTKVHAKPGGVVLLQLDHVDQFVRDCPDLFASLHDAVAFVNWRQVHAGRAPVLAIAYERG
jgi:hypothetical protein